MFKKLINFLFSRPEFKVGDTVYYKPEHCPIMYIKTAFKVQIVGEDSIFVFHKAGRNEIYKFWVYKNRMIRDDS